MAEKVRMCQNLKGRRKEKCEKYAKMDQEERKPESPEGVAKKRMTKKTKNIKK